MGEGSDHCICTYLVVLIAFLLEFIQYKMEDGSTLNQTNIANDSGDTSIVRPPHVFCGTFFANSAYGSIFTLPRSYNYYSFQRLD